MLRPLFLFFNILLILDYTLSAEKTYKRELKNIKPDLAEYRRARDEVLGNGQVAGSAEKGEIVDNEGKFYANANTLGFTEHKPAKERLDLLVEQTKRKYVTYKPSADMTGKRIRRQKGERNALGRKEMLIISIRETKFSIKSLHGMVSNDKPITDL